MKGAPLACLRIIRFPILKLEDHLNTCFESKLNDTTGWTCMVAHTTLVYKARLYLQKSL